MIEKKPKKCKGINKAYGFDGCGTLTLYRENGLCQTCLVEWWFNTERGKVDYATQKNSLNKSKWKEQKKVLKEKTKTLSDYEAEARKEFQKFIRLRDAEHNCISCDGNDKDLWDGGHFFKAELFSGLIFNENNCHKQCRKCNRFLNGNELQYRFGLIRRYGADYVANLESISDQNRVYKFSKSELIEIKKEYENKIKQLTS